MKDINPGANTIIIPQSTFVTLGNSSIVYFAGSSDAFDAELWKSDGTAAGTTLVKDIYSGPGASRPSAIVLLNSKPFFSAGDHAHGRELWTLGYAVNLPLINR